MFGDFRPDIIWRCTPYKANQSAVCRLIYEPPTYGDRCGHDDPDDNVTTQLSALCLGQPTSDKVVDLGPLLCGQFRHDALSSLSRASVESAKGRRGAGKTSLNPPGTPSGPLTPRVTQLNPTFRAAI